jgi:hypothetical protein
MALHAGLEGISREPLVLAAQPETCKTNGDQDGEE